MGKDYYEAVVTYYRMTSWTAFENNENCVKEVLGTLYWEALEKMEAVEEKGSYTSLVVLVVVIVGISAVAVGVSVYVIKKKEEALLNCYAITRPIRAFTIGY
eukprot:TRINITY_DN14116_c0_g6_i1.p4 TRINITY_DN14116_c0_g6~~TRINITY_DN14116_c0_g6_i1.p4  ORF type:complete len:102 (-),score=26.97 TRINITY_DN14116_c0_g6_i1:91-396(-)